VSAHCFKIVEPLAAWKVHGVSCDAFEVILSGFRLCAVVKRELGCLS
jgi:hypothetical protein